MRRAGLLGAVLCTALMLVLFPGLLRSLRMESGNRMNESLRPKSSTTITLWVVGAGEDQKLISRVVTKYEKENKNIRVYVRKIREEELYQPDAILPDLVLYTTGSVLMPETVFKPLQEEEQNLAALSGESGMIRYGIPLWFSPNVLSLPREWFQKEAAAGEGSFFGQGTPAPPSGEGMTWENVPWEKLCGEGMVQIAPGCALQQMQINCPKNGQKQLAAAAEIRQEPLPEAKVACAGSYQRLRGKSSWVHMLLHPVVSHEVRYASLCSEKAEAKALLRYFQMEEAAAEAAKAGWLSLWRSPGQDDPILQEAWQEVQTGIYLPNAYAAGKNELEECCRAGFMQTADPVETLLRLR